MSLLVLLVLGMSRGHTVLELQIAQL